jgi:hypothetical protein
VRPRRSPVRARFAAVSLGSQRAVHLSSQPQSVLRKADAGRIPTREDSRGRRPSSDAVALRPSRAARGLGAQVRAELSPCSGERTPDCRPGWRDDPASDPNRARVRPKPCPCPGRTPPRACCGIRTPPRATCAAFRQRVCVLIPPRHRRSRRCLQTRSRHERRAGVVLRLLHQDRNTLATFSARVPTHTHNQLL